MTDPNLAARLSASIKQVQFYQEARNNMMNELTPNHNWSCVEESSFPALPQILQSQAYQAALESFRGDKTLVESKHMLEIPIGSEVHRCHVWFNHPKNMQDVGVEFKDYTGSWRAVGTYTSPE